MTMTRAYSTLELKAVDDASGKRRFTGVASTINADRMQDVVEPKGMEANFPVPLLWQHDHQAPIGWVTAARVSAKQIEVDCEMAVVDEPGKLKDQLDHAWQAIKAKLVRGLSIGFQSLESARIEGTYGVRFSKWSLLELSAVTIPANADCSITSIKSIDQQILAASGHRDTRVVRLNKPGASGSNTKAVKAIPKPKPLEGQMNVQDQIQQFTATRAEKALALDAIVAKSVETGETFDVAQTEEYDTLKGEIGTIDTHLARLRDHEKTVAAKAAPVTVTSEDPTKTASASRTGAIVIGVEKKLPPGVGFARLAGAIAAAKGSFSDAERIVKSRFPDDKKLHNIVAHMDRIKAATDVGTTTDTDYASPLVQYRDLQDEFIEFVRPQTIIGQIPGFRRVPFNISVPRQTSGGSASWVGEGAPKPVTQFAFDNVTLGHTKLASIAVITQELARFSSPSAEMVIRDSLAGALIQQMDSDFINPANSGTSNVKPASITNGVSAVPSSGNTEANVREDIINVFAPFIAANLTPRNGVWIMSATNALSLSLMVNALGQLAFPGITMEGGTFWGMPVIVSEAVGNIVVLANAHDILLADDGEVTIDSSSEASVQMDSAPTNPPVAATVLISLWQMNLLGIRAERFINWTKARAASVQYLSGVEWGQPAS